MYLAPLLTPSLYIDNKALVCFANVSVFKGDDLRNVVLFQR